MKMCWELAVRVRLEPHKACSANLAGMMFEWCRGMHMASQLCLWGGLQLAEHTRAARCNWTEVCTYALPALRVLP
jgi:hypothetical protein